MDRAAARANLGLDPEATTTEILAAYGKRSRRLKRRLVQARTLVERDRARRALRNLTVVRDIALGPDEATALGRRRAGRLPVLVDDWWQPEDGVPASVGDHAAAIAWLGLDRYAAPETIRRILLARARKLKVRIAHAPSEYDLEVHQRALSDLERLASLALAPQPDSGIRVVSPASPRAPRTLDDEGTMTDTHPKR